MDSDHFKDNFSVPVEQFDQLVQLVKLFNQPEADVDIMCSAAKPETCSS